MRAEGRPSGSTVASVIACAFRISANASFSQLSRSGSGLSGSSAGSAGLVTLFLQKGKRAGHVRGTYRRRGVDVGRVRGAETVDAQEPETDPDLLFQELEPPHETRLAGGGEAAARKTSNPHRLRAQRDGLHDVRAPHERAVDDDRRSPPHGRDDLGQDVHGAPAVVELPAAVIGDVDALDP